MNRYTNTVYVSDDPLNDRDIYDYVRDIAIKEIVDMTDNMIVSVDTFDCWFLSAKDGNRLVKILNSKKRIIISSFKFELKRNFSDFKSIPKTRLTQNLDRGRYSLKLAGVDPDAERLELESIISGYEEIYSDFYCLIIQRLQHCIQRSQVSSSENPFHVKRLYEALQFSLDSLDLESKYQIAIYRLFASNVVNELSTTYEKIDRFLIEKDILPDLLSMKQKQESRETIPENKVHKPIMGDSPDIQTLVFEHCDGKETKGSIFQDLSQRLIELDMVLPMKSVDYLDDLFNSIFNEKYLPDAIKRQLGRLQSHSLLYAIENELVSDLSLDSAFSYLNRIVEREVRRFQQSIDPESNCNCLKQAIDKIDFAQSINVDELWARYLTHIENNPVQPKSKNRFKKKLKASIKTESPEKQAVINKVNNTSIENKNSLNEVVTPIEPGPKTEITHIAENNDYAANIQKGEWVEIVEGITSKIGKLVWKADDCSLLIFVDNTGNRIKEVDGNQFNRELKLGSIRLVTTSSVAANSTHFSVIQKFMGRLTPWSTR